MADALEQLKERLIRVTDLQRIARLLSWDQQTMMPPAGSEARADHLATLSRLAHELFVDEETGRLLDELRPLADSISIAIDRGGSAGLVWTDQGTTWHGNTHITYGCVTAQQSAIVGANSGLSCKGPASP